MSRARNRLAGVALSVLTMVAVIAAPSHAADSGWEDTWGLVDPATGYWMLYGGPPPVAGFYYGNPGDYPFVGDWDCDGVATPGLCRQSDGYVYLRNSNSQGNADITFYFGNPGDVPVAGDFNTDGCDTVSIYRPSNQTFYIINQLGTNDGGLGAANYHFVFGNPGDKPFIGDFNGNGQDTIGLHRESTGLVYYRNTNTQGNADNQFIFGDPGDRFVAGDWTADGIDSPGLFRPSNETMYLRYTNTQGNADETWPYAGNTWLPAAGKLGDCENQTTIPATECEALVALYKSTDGPNWHNNDRWLTDPDPCTWQGVGCSDKGVRALDLPGNDLSGPIPPELGNLTNLIELHLDWNQLTGPIPPEIGSLTNLSGLILEDNQLTGPIPSEIGNLTNLTRLYLHRNQLTGPIPANLTNLTNLVDLHLAVNQLTGPIPAELGNLTNLVDLYLEENQMTGQIPSEIDNLAGLQWLDLSFNGLSGPIPSEIGSLTNLSGLILEDNHLSGPIPDALMNLTNLYHMYLSGQTGCLTAGSPTLAAWLSSFDVLWNDGCPG